MADGDVAAKPHFMIISSMKFAEDIVAKRGVLETLGYAVSVPNDTDLMLSTPTLCDDLEADLQHCKEQDELRRGFDLVAAADAVLVLNHPKNGVEGYIGTSVLMELAISHYLRKHIFLLFPTPSFHEHRWAHEVAMMSTCCLHGDATRLPVGLAAMKSGGQFECSFEGTEARFRELLHWSWQVIGHKACKSQAMEDVSKEESTVDTPNRERDRSRILAKGFVEFPSETKVKTKCKATGVQVANGYVRLLFGDHGPYLELLHEHVCWEAFVHHKLKGPLRHYHEHLTRDRGIQIYEQFRSVHDEPHPPPGEWACDNNRPEGYADYRPGRIYMPADLVEPC